MRVVDANVLLYAVDDAAPQHAASARWLDEALDGGDNVGLSWSELLAFVGIATNPRIMPHPVPLEDAMAQVHDWVAAPSAHIPSAHILSAHILHPGERHAMILESLLVVAEVVGEGQEVEDSDGAWRPVCHREEPHSESASG